MFKIILAVFAFFLLTGLRAQERDSGIVHSIFLFGDAGEPYLRDSPLVTVAREQISEASPNSTVLFLGDNIYPSGMPAKGHPKYELADLSLRTQVNLVDGLQTRAIFIPGNHDWQHWGKRGREYLMNQQRWLDSLKNGNIVMLPRDGCPGPVQVPIDDRNLLVILDTQWFLHQWDKPRDADLCQAITTAEVLAMVEDIFTSNPGKRIILAAHHPLITYGEHGGIFTWKAHIFPLEEITQYLYIPFPIVGSIYPLYRKWFGHLQDTAHPLYREFGDALRRIMREHPGSVYVAGHEHALQYIVRDSTHFIVSGSAAKTEYVKKKKYAIYAKDVRGFARLSLLSNGSLSFAFFQVDDDHPEGVAVFRRSIAPVSQPSSDVPGHFELAQRRVKVRASDQYEAGKLKQWLLGDNYRSAWAQEVDVDVFDIGKVMGGLKILQKGGGQQTLSLRLADSAGHEYVLRSVEKFPERAIPEALRETFAQDLVQDQISASHPYAALVVAPMAEAVGLYHTNPRLVYIPDDPRLGPYRETFANTLALFEERPDEDWRHASFFGNSRNIVSTRKLLEKLEDDNDNAVDETFVLRNRLFDMIIGDWDRHDDQWRWATLEKEKGNLYRPIPRDRDQTFFLNEGVLTRIWSRRWALPKFEGFDEDIDWPSGLSFNARHFDRSFLTRLSRQQWIETAEALRRDLTDKVIESSVRQWPPAIYALHGEEVIQKLKTRRDNIVRDAEAHYEFLAREVDITGSDKREVFEVKRQPNGDVHVSISKMTKEGERGRQIYERVFRKSETGDIRLYGLGGDDRFEVNGEATGSIRVRVIGGEGQDRLTDASVVKSVVRKTLLYDNGDGVKFNSAGEVRDLTSFDPAVNRYDRMAFEYDRLAPLVYGQYNFDDGVFFGGGFLFIKHGFRKQPFSQRHVFLASFAPLTSSYNFAYQSRFTEVVGEWDLEVDADVKAPNYVNNFFGMGNESVFNRDIDDEPEVDVDESIHYYRYRFEEISLSTTLSRAVGSFGTVMFGPIVQRVEMEEPLTGQDRYIGTYAATLPDDIFSGYSTFAGLGWQFKSGHERDDDDLFDRRGMRLHLSGKHLDGSGGNDFSSYSGSLAIHHSFREKSRLVFAGRVGGGINTGKYPFYQSQVLDGPTNLRGFRKTRFYGDARVYANIEARLRLASFRSYLFPASFGILAFHDVGRIWYKNEDGVDPSAPEGKSRQWHRGWGGGMWFTPFNLTVLSVEAAHSPEGTLGYMRLGFLF